RFAVVIRRYDTGKLRERSEQLRSCDSASGEEAGAFITGNVFKRVRKPNSQRIGSRNESRIDHPAHNACVNEILVRYRIKFANNFEVVAVVTDICRFSNKSPRQFPLDADLPAKLLTRLRILIEEGNGAPETGYRAREIANRLKYRNGRW